MFDAAKLALPVASQLLRDEGPLNTTIIVVPSIGFKSLGIIGSADPTCGPGGIRCPAANVDVRDTITTSV